MEHYFVILLMLVLSAFFSGMEIAFVSANKIHIEIEKKQNSFLATILKRLTKRPSKFIATMLVGNNIALVIYGFMMGDLLSHMLFSQYLAFSVLPIKILLLQTIISTLVILLTAEFLPKVFFQVYANSLLKFFAIPAYIFYVTFSFISEFIIWISDVILKKIFKTQGDSLQLSFSKVELGNYISEQMESVREEDTVDSEIQIFQNALDFSEVKAREVMIPRTEIVAVDINTTPKDLVKLFSETGYSKILVYKENIDDIIGYVHAFELFKKPESLKEILIPVVFVPETMLVKDSLNILIKKRESIAIILDEYGGTSGMMTIEDIIEELFGEIEDEHDITELIEEKFSDTLYKFSARLEVDYLNENYKLNLPENENYETLGGMIVYFAEEIPNKNEIVEIEQFNFKILEVSNTKIELVELEITSEK
ncbi:MAG: hemolysin [Flavobacteriaceae bacterium CG2_30_34_30]|nr:MAG: hemolysin [Flavobacteriaceae bacterium CG2_30_34_30]